MIREEGVRMRGMELALLEARKALDEGEVAVGAVLTLGNKLCGSVLFHLYAAARGYTVYLDGTDAYLEQALFDANLRDRVFAADFQQVFAFVGALLIAFGLVRFFKHLNAEQ